MQWTDVTFRSPTLNVRDNREIPIDHLVEYTRGLRFARSWNLEWRLTFTNLQFLDQTRIETKFAVEVG